MSDDLYRGLMEVYAKMNDKPFFGGNSITWFTEGDRLRIKDGYEDSGKVLWYVAKSTADPDMSVVTVDGDTERFEILTAAIEAYPYSREERIERAIEDLVGLGAHVHGTEADSVAALFAIIDAGI